jgi:hypothetical protein
MGEVLATVKLLAADSEVPVSIRCLFAAGKEHEYLLEEAEISTA